MQQWKTLKKTTILDFNKFLRVEQHSVALPDGRIIQDWPWIVSPDYVLVLPVTGRNTLLLFRQTKYAVDGTSLAPIGGYLEPGEDALTAAQRELREEMGCEAAEWIPLGSYPVNGNHGGGIGHLFIALDAVKTGQPIIDDLEEMEPGEYTIKETEQKLLGGEVKVQGWVTVIALGLLYLKQMKRFTLC
ncbi:MAG: NUDIX hydrolase [Ignavibacteriae bacterium]|nr:MAG: NUDIX hydrolase [Ignavibacteriota bacterium]